MKAPRRIKDHNKSTLAQGGCHASVREQPEDKYKKKKNLHPDEGCDQDCLHQSYDFTTMFIMYVQFIFIFNLVYIKRFILKEGFVIFNISVW